MLISLLTVIACSDYNLAPNTAAPSIPENIEEPTATVIVNENDEPADDDTATTATEEPVETGACNGFVVQQAFRDDAITTSYATFSPVGDTFIEVRPGETARYQLAITASDCGNVTSHMIDIALDDEGGHDWLQLVNDAQVGMVLENQTEGITYDEYATHTLNVSNGDSLFYTWYDGEVGGSLNGAADNMDEINVEAGRSKIVEFDFTATEFAPIGTSFDVFLIDACWTDEATAQYVCDLNAGDGTAITVTIIE